MPTKQEPSKIDIAFSFPNQLVEKIELYSKVKKVYLVEEYLFFNQYKYHKAKLAFARASMKFYEQYLLSKNITVEYINAQDARCDVRKLILILADSINTLYFYDPVDDWLNRRIVKSCKDNGVSFTMEESPIFLNNTKDLVDYFSTKKRMFQTDFYVHQRKLRNILMEEDGKPIGGKWTYDTENRLKYPKGKIAPKITFQTLNEFDLEARNYVDTNYSNNPGSYELKYPTTFTESKAWLRDFFVERFFEFGEYEDAIVENENYLHHSLISPLINAGLLTPQFVITETLKFATKNKVPLNSTEGFIRQILGWREFIRAVYILKGRKERTTNFWGFDKKMPDGFYTGDTGMVPLDNAIKKVLKTGYNHHIERLMILGNIMLLSEIHPDEVYRWFMEMYIDAYDWVMVPNVYGMSQFADGGLMATKPYISGSNYILKMSNLTKGEWQKTMDALFWDFMDVNRDFFLKNPRLGMLLKTYDKKDKSHVEMIKKIKNEWFSHLFNK